MSSLNWDELFDWSSYRLGLPVCTSVQVRLMQDSQLHGDSGQLRRSRWSSACTSERTSFKFVLRYEWAPLFCPFGILGDGLLLICAHPELLERDLIRGGRARLLYLTYITKYMSESTSSLSLSLASLSLWVKTEMLRENERNGARLAHRRQVPS